MWSRKSVTRPRLIMMSAKDPQEQGKSKYSVCHKTVRFGTTLFMQSLVVDLSKFNGIFLQIGH